MAQYGIKEVMNFSLTNYSPNPYKRMPIVYVDYAQVTSMAVGGERHTINGGRGNRALLSFDHTKTSQFSLTLPLVDLKVLALISGDEVEEKIREIYTRDVLNIQDGETGVEGEKRYVELERSAIENSIHLYELEGSVDLGSKVCPELMDADSTIVERAGYKLVEADNGKHRLYLNDDVAVGVDTLVAYYHSETKGKVTTMRINPEKFPKAVSFYGEALWRDQDSELDEIFQVIGHKGRILPEYELNMSGTDSAVLELTLEMFAVNDPIDNTPVYIEYIKDDVQDHILEDVDPCDGEEVVE